MHHWLHVHAPMSHGAEDLYGYVCGEVLGEMPTNPFSTLEMSAAIDGVAQMWFEHEDGLSRLPRQPKVKEWFGDGPNFIGRRMRFMADENVIVPPLRTANADPKLVFLVARDRSVDEVAFRQAIDGAGKQMNEARFAGLGLAISHIVSSPLSASVPTFPMANIDSVVEVWLQDEEDGHAATEAVITKLLEAPRKLAIAGARIFLVRDTVIRRPASEH